MKLASRRDYAFILIFLSLITVLAWFDMYQMAAGSHGSNAHGGSEVVYLSHIFLMWNITIVAMMVPTAVPMILTFVYAAERQQGVMLAATISFLAGYLVLWIGFSAVATLNHRALENAALLSSVTMRSLPPLAAILLLGAGVYQ